MNNPVNNTIPVITIDGPSGTGKGTVSQLLAQHLDWHYLDSGALYRVLAFAAKQHAIPMDNESALEVLAGHLDVQFINSTILLEGDNISKTIRTEECSANASKIAAFPKVRQALLGRQRAFAEPPGLVTDGRDMGTVVFPHALLKIYLIASEAIRAQRRYHQLKAKGNDVTLAQVVKELTKRDQRDAGRTIAPLKAADDAITIDTSDLSIEQVLEHLVILARGLLAT